MNLSLKNLDIGYSNEPLVSDINVDFHLGQISVITGKNGEGKTTLLRTIAGLLPKLSGSINPLSKDFKIGWLNNYQPEMQHILVKEYLTYGISSPNFNEIKNLLIEPLYDQFIDEVSSGQFKKIAIARQLLKTPNLLILDEPTAFLDIESKQELIRLLNSIKTNKIILIISHDVDFFKKVGDSFYQIKSGKLLPC